MANVTYTGGSYLPGQPPAGRIRGGLLGRFAVATRAPVVELRDASLVERTAQKLPQETRHLAHRLMRHIRPAPRARRRRSDERRVGKEVVMTCRSRWTQLHDKTKK